MDKSNKDVLGNIVEALRKQSRTYRGDDCGNVLCLSKTWNRGMGRQSFIQVLPDEGVVLYNTLLTSKRDLARIKDAFPEFAVEPVNKPYYSTSSLLHHRNEKLQNYANGSICRI